MSNRSRRSTKTQNTKAVIFDEENLARTYHPADKTYGFMQIDEPDTPHPHKGKPVNSAELRKKLEQLRDLERVSSASFVPAAGEDAESHFKEQRKKDFEERRKKNYSGEFLRAKEALKKLKDDDGGNSSQTAQKEG